MRGLSKIFPAAILLLGLVPRVAAQTDPNIYGKIITVDTTETRVLQVNRILIIGNKVTKDRIITRELTLKPGDTINSKHLATVLQLDKNKIYNLRIFNTVTIRILELSPNQIDLLIEVTERWYTFPVPIFELSDRNFNEWWQNYNHDFNRVNYGLRLYQYNFRGRNETLRLTAQFGFVRRFDLTYRIPNLGRNQKQGLTFNLEYGEPKNLAYFTKDHKLLYLESKNVLKTTRLASVEYTYRKSFYDRHSIGLEYRSSNISDTIVSLNPNYYKSSRNHQEFEAISYSFSSDHRDVAAYPLNGYYFTAYLSKVGLGISSDVNQAEVNITYGKYSALKNGYYLSNFSSVYASTPTSQPYSLYSALGYRKQFLRGYEVYVIEGPMFFLNKTTFKKRIFSRAWDFEDMPIDQFRHFPLAIYLKGYADFGYVQNFPRYEELSINNTLSNRFLAGAGGGIDIVTLYDAVLRFEYTFTREGTHGFFFHVKKEF